MSFALAEVEGLAFEWCRDDVVTAAQGAQVSRFHPTRQTGRGNAVLVGVGTVEVVAPGAEALSQGLGK